MAALRVLHVSPYAPEAWAYGGIPRVVGSLTRGLADHGIAVTLVTTDACDANRRLATRIASDGVVRQVFRNRSNRLAYRSQFFTPRGMGSWLGAHASEYDLAHVHGCHHLPGALAARAFRKAGRPYVVQPHGTAPLIERRRLAKALFDLAFASEYLTGAARVLAVSESERRALAGLGVAAERLEEVPNPIDAGELEAPPRRGAFRARLGLGDEPLVLFLARISPRKRADLLVEAFARLADPRARLVVAGNDAGGLDTARRAAQRAGVAARVGFPGFLSKDERLAALADADLVVYPSQHEVFGLVAAEAILCRTPVVVSDDSGCGEWVRAVGGGRLFRAGDADDLARVMSDALARPETLRAELAAAGDRLRREHSPAAVATRVAAVYRAVLS